MLSEYKTLISQLPIQFAKAKESGHLNSYPSTTEIVNDNGLDVRFSSLLLRSSSFHLLLTLSPFLPFLLQFELRVCPALEAKRAAALNSEPSSVNEDGKPVPQGKRQKAADPFEGPYEGNDLYLGKVGQEDDGLKMVGLLNRFSVVDEHFLLVSEGELSFFLPFSPLPIALRTLSAELTDLLLFAEFESQSSPLQPPHLLHAYLTLMALKNAGREFIAIYNCGEKSGASQKRRQ